MERAVKERGREGIGVFTFFTFLNAPFLGGGTLGTPAPTANFPRRPTDPHGPSYVHLETGDASSEVDEVEQVVHIRHLPG